MKIKILIILLCFFLGMLQNSIGQEPDSLLLEKVQDTTLIISNLDTLLVDNNEKLLFQLDSLRIMYQEKESELKILGKLIDSLAILVSNQLSDSNIFYQDSSSLYQDSSILSISKDSSNFNDEDEDWKKLYGFLFKIEYCKPFKDSLYITARIKYLEGANIVFRVHIESFDTYYQKNTLKDKKIGSKVEFISSSISSNDEVFYLRIALKKENLGIDTEKIKIKIDLIVSNTSPSNYQKYMNIMHPPIKNYWQKEHAISLKKTR
jgi:hypothetical protein